MGFSPHLGSDSGPHRREGRRLTQRTVVWCVSLCVLFSLAVVGIWYGVRAVTPQPLPLGTGTNPASAVTVQQAISLPVVSLLLVLSLLLVMMLRGLRGV